MNRKKKENLFRRTNFSFKGKFSFITKKKKKKKKKTNKHFFFKRTNVYYMSNTTAIYYFITFLQTIDVLNFY